MCNLRPAFWIGGPLQMCGTFSYVRSSEMHRRASTLSPRKQDRVDKGGDPELIRSSEIKRFRGTKRVDLVLEADENWRKARFRADNLNKLKNLCSKTVAKRIQEKNNSPDCEPNVFDELSTRLDSLVEADLVPLSVSQLKSLSCLIDEEIKSNGALVVEYESIRQQHLYEIGNLLHPDVPISKDEEDNLVIRLSEKVTF
ncbi:unnamed protein product [Heterobilharzia americana]|nr:unnamed protein product [Heterobilharzia americana]